MFSDIDDVIEKAVADARRQAFAEAVEIATKIGDESPSDHEAGGAYMVAEALRKRAKGE